MAGVNLVILIGHLGKDPDVRYTPDGKAITNFNLATSEKWKDKNTGESRDKTEWHRVVLFGGLAKIAGDYLKKGSKIYLEGKLQTRKWTDQHSIERYSTEVIVDSIHGKMSMFDKKES